MSSKAELLKKVKALADQGYGGEKEAAANLLDRLMKKYGISEEEISEDAVTAEFFRYRDNIERTLLSQLVYMVTGQAARCVVGSASGRLHKEVGCNCTKSQKLEIEASFEFYRNAIREDLDIFMCAFINKNHLFPENVEAKDPEDLPPEKRERLSRAGMLMDCLEEHRRFKQIEGGTHA